MKKFLLFLFLLSGSMRAVNWSFVYTQDPQTAQDARERLTRVVNEAVWADKWIIPVGAVLGACCFMLCDTNPHNHYVYFPVAFGTFCIAGSFAVALMQSSIEARKDYWKVLRYCAESENPDLKRVEKEAGILRKLHMSRLGMVPSYVLTAALAVGIANVPVKQ